jgi:hypothetical protein
MDTSSGSNFFFLRAISKSNYRPENKDTFEIGTLFGLATCNRFFCNSTSSVLTLAFTHPYIKQGRGLVFQDTRQTGE